MSCLPPGTSDNSRKNEATPLLHDEDFEYDDELYAIGGAVGGSPTAIEDSTESIDDSTTATGDTSECTDEAISVAQEDIDNIVGTLFSAWLQFPPRRANEPKRENSELLGPRALLALYTAWRKIKAERDVLPKSEVIVRGLAQSMVDYIYPLEENTSKYEYVFKKLLFIRVVKTVAAGWKQITDRIEAEDRERARRKRERRQRIREKMRRSREVAEVLRFYAPFARIDYSVPLNCTLFCNYLCHCCSIFLFQVPIHTLLLAWPISLGVMGGLYMTQCPMSYLMPYVMIALGAVGTLALLIRLSFVIYEKFTDDKIRSMGLWILLKVTEFTFLDFLMVQLFYFFSETPSFVPGSPKYCNETFYSFVYYANYVSIALVSAWILVYFIKGCVWWRTRKFLCSQY